MAARRVVAFLSLACVAAALFGADPPAPNADLEQLRQQAETLRAQAEACAESRCLRCDCASLIHAYQALVDAETVLDALHGALIEASAAALANYNNLASNSHLTGTKLAQLQDSLAWQEFFHKLGSYLLKIESILNTLDKIDSGKAAIDGDKGALDALDKLDSLANALKNSADLTNDLAGQLATGALPASGDAKGAINTGWDVKSEAVDAVKVAKAVREAYETGKKVNQGAAAVKEALASSRNLRTAIARALKAYSEYKLKQEKLVLVELTGNLAPEAEAITRAYQEWQRVNARKYATADALAAVRAAKEALAACLERAKCGSKSSSRPKLPVFKSYGEALSDIDARLPALLAALKVELACKDDCGEPGTTPTTTPPPPKGGPGTTPLPPPKHIVENNCPQCAALALELARTLDEMEFVRAELSRIRANVEKAQALETDAQLLRDAIDRLTKLIIDFRQGKKGKNALLDAGNKLFDFLGKPHTEITLSNMEREKRERQIRLHQLEERIAALGAEAGHLDRLQKENARLYDLAESLRAQLALCQKRCVPPRGPCSVAEEELKHWREKAAKFPNQANRNAAAAALRKLCDCLAEHPEAMTEELTKLCPPPAKAKPKPRKTANSTIGLLIPNGARPDDTVHCTLVTNPQDWRQAQGVRVVEIEARLPVDDAGRPLLGETTVAFDGGAAQPADRPATCTIPHGGTTTVAIGIAGQTTPVVEKPVACGGGAPAPAPSQPTAPAACVKDLLFRLDGPFGGDTRETSVSMGGKPATLVAGTPREWHCLPPADAAPGRTTLDYREGGKRWRTEVAVIALVVSADRTELLRGQSTTFHAKVLGLEGIPEAAWSAPFAADAEMQKLLAGAAPESAASATRGRVLLAIENRSRDVISIDGESAGRIVVDIDRGAIRNGTFELARTIRSKQRGRFDIYAQLVVLMAPVPMQPVSGE